MSGAEGKDAADRTDPGLLIYRKVNGRQSTLTYCCVIPAGAESFKSMPYSANTDLPASVRNHLPGHAQDIYRAAFNHAYAAHAGEADRETRAHKIAWAAVKRGYVKQGDSWVPLQSAAS